MALNCDVTLGKKFPFVVACVLRDGFQEKQKASKRYLGGVVSHQKMQVALEALIIDESDVKFFAYWWHYEISNGTDNFTMNIPIYGVDYDYTMKLLGDFDTTLTPEKGRKVVMLLEVQEDLESILETAICADFGTICN